MPEKEKIVEKRVKISGTIPKEMFKWVEEQIKSGKFYNKSHVIEAGIRKLQKKDDWAVS